MQRTIGRLGLGIFTGLALFVFSAAPALATTVTTQPASNVTTTTAVVNGLVDTGGVATAWQFQWGATAKYGRATPLQQIPAGNGMVPVSWSLTDLSPNTTYHFRLVATTGTGTGYYPLSPFFGQDVSFTTRPSGTLVLLRHRLTVDNGFVTVPLLCKSGLTCHGRFTMSTLGRIQGTNTFANVLCATTFFTIKPHQVGNVRVRVRHGCLALLNSSRTHSVIAKLTSNPRTGQKALITRLVLTLNHVTVTRG
jgi:hypothetical protein